MAEIARRVILGAICFVGIAACAGPEQRILGRWQDAEGYYCEFFRNGQVTFGYTLHYTGTWTIAEDGDVVIMWMGGTTRGRLTEQGLVVSFGSRNPRTLQHVS